eukprot:403376759
MGMKVLLRSQQIQLLKFGSQIFISKKHAKQIYKNEKYFWVPEKREVTIAKQEKKRLDDQFQIEKLTAQTANSKRESDLRILTLIKNKIRNAQKKKPSSLNITNEMVSSVKKSQRFSQAMSPNKHTYSTIFDKRESQLPISKQSNYIINTQQNFVNEVSDSPFNLASLQLKQQQHSENQKRKGNIPIIVGQLNDHQNEYLGTQEKEKQVISSKSGSPIESIFDDQEEDLKISLKSKNNIFKDSLVLKKKEITNSFSIDATQLQNNYDLAKQIQNSKSQYLTSNNNLIGSSTQANLNNKQYTFMEPDKIVKNLKSDSQKALAISSSGYIQSYQVYKDEKYKKQNNQQSLPKLETYTVKNKRLSQFNLSRKKVKKNKTEALKNSKIKDHEDQDSESNIKLFNIFQR